MCITVSSDVHVCDLACVTDNVYSLCAHMCSLTLTPHPVQLRSLDDTGVSSLHYLWFCIQCPGLHLEDASRLWSGVRSCAVPALHRKCLVQDLGWGWLSGKGILGKDEMLGEWVANNRHVLKCIKKSHSQPQKQHCYLECRFKPWSSCIL